MNNLKVYILLFFFPDVVKIECLVLLLLRIISIFIQNENQSGTMEIIKMLIC